MAYRDFTDNSGVEWKVWDTYPHSAANVRAGYAGGWLSFESSAERRRLQPVPAGWAQATEDELWEWLGRASVVRVLEVDRILEDLVPHPKRAAWAQARAETRAEDASRAAATAEEPVATEAATPEPAAGEAEDAEDSRARDFLHRTQAVVQKARHVIQLVNATLKGEEKPEEQKPAEEAETRD